MYYATKAKIYKKSKISTSFLNAKQKEHKANRYVTFVKNFLLVEFEIPIFKYRLFFTSVTALEREKTSAQKIKKQFFSKISSIL